MKAGLSVVSSVGSGSPSAPLRGRGGWMEASEPTTLAILSVLKGIRSSSQLAGE